MENPFRQKSARRETGIFSRRMETLRPHEVAREQSRRETECREKQIYSIFDVQEYLERTGRPELCRDPYLCDRWQVEPTLIRDLFKALKKTEEKNDSPEMKEVNYLRGLIRARSAFPPRRISNEEILASLDFERALRGSDWFESVKKALDSKMKEEELENLVRLVEDEYAGMFSRWEIALNPETKKRIAREIDGFRPLRDRLYLLRVHPNFLRS